MQHHLYAFAVCTFSLKLLYLLCKVDSMNIYKALLNEVQLFWGDFI